MADKDIKSCYLIRQQVANDKHYGTNVSERQPSTASKGCFGSRHVFALLSFFGLASVFMCRVNLSVAIVHMVRHYTIASFANTSALPVTDHCPLSNEEEEIVEVLHHGEFDWDSRTQGLVLGAFYWGYIVPQIPAGILSERYGGKHVFGSGLLLAGIFTLLTPVAARFNIGALIAMRVLVGLSEGLTLPAMHNMISSWIPAQERAMMGSFILSGMPLGTVISIPLSGLLCSIKMDNGWPWTFYVPGAVSVLCYIAWFSLVFDSPQAHPYIALEEKLYIGASSRASIRPENLPTPWKKIITSTPVWAIQVAYLGKAFGYNVLLTELPTYMKTVLHFDLHTNTLLSALPYLAMGIFSLAFSLIADAFGKKAVSTTATRKIFNTIGFVFPALALVGASLTGCDPIASVTLITLASGFKGAVSSGHLINHIDVASNYAGVLMGITNSVANICGFLAPFTVGHIVTTPGSLYQWQIVFSITAGIYVVTGMFYAVFATAEEQNWNRLDQDEA